LTLKKFQKRLFVEIYIPVMSLKILSGRNLRRIYALKKSDIALKFCSKFYNGKLD
jgi:DNA polymerase II small subunit/DNA polymerase delta subunit B